MTTVANTQSWFAHGGRGMLTACLELIQRKYRAPDLAIGQTAEHRGAEPRRIDVDKRFANPGQAGAVL